MKKRIGENRHERRSKHYITPLIYMLLEIVIVWLVISIVMVDFNISHWTLLGKISLAIPILFFLYKTIKIYIRQKNYKRRK